MAIHTVIWRHPILGTGRYERDAATPREAGEECADIFAGQPVYIQAWTGRYTKVISVKPHYQIDNG